MHISFNARIPQIFCFTFYILQDCQIMLHHWPEWPFFFFFFLSFCSQKSWRKTRCCVLRWWTGRWVFTRRAHWQKDNSMRLTVRVHAEHAVFLCVAEGKPPAPPTGIDASETDRMYVVLRWNAPAYSSKAPMWYYIEKVLSPVLLACTPHGGTYL